MRPRTLGMLVFGVGAAIVAAALAPTLRLLPPKPQPVLLPVYAKPIVFFREKELAVPVGTLPVGITSLNAAACAQCHADEHSDWAGSPHAHSSTEPVFAAAFQSEPRALCRACHSPLREQQPMLVKRLTEPPKVLFTGALRMWTMPAIVERNPKYDAKLSTEGVNCVTCHVREGTVLTANASALPAPHSLSYSPKMREPNYCAGCHQFDVENPVLHPFELRNTNSIRQSGFEIVTHLRLNKLAGNSAPSTPASQPETEQNEEQKSDEDPPIPPNPMLETQYQQEARVQHTFQEFRASPAAAQGETCQSCHMPPGKDGRRHLFAGSGSLEMLRKAVSLTARLDRPNYAPGDRLQAEITLRNDAGHRFPTGDSIHAGILDVWLRDGRKTLGRQVFLMSNQRLFPFELDLADDGKFRMIFRRTPSQGATLKIPKRADTRLIAGETVKLTYQQKLSAAITQAAAPELVVRVYHADVHPGFRGSGIDPKKRTLKLFREERLPIQLEPGPQTVSLRKTSHRG